ncbi:MAG: hypothetical protein WBP61_02510 [Nocardioides sp.]
MRAVLVPGVLALLPEHASQVDPVAELRASCTAAVGWLGADVTVLAGPQGRRVGDHLLASADRAGTDASWLVVGNGSAKRTEKAPGHVDPRAEEFDAALGEALVAGRIDGLDLTLAADLWADTDALAELGRVLPVGCRGRVDYADDPYGVQWWVVRWEW